MSTKIQGKRIEAAAVMQQAMQLHSSAQGEKPKSSGCPTASSVKLCMQKWLAQQPGSMQAASDCRTAAHCRYTLPMPAAWPGTACDALHEAARGFACLESNLSWMMHAAIST